MAPEVLRSRARFPGEYAVATSEEGLLPLDWLVTRLEQARNYWLATLDPAGKPHVRPVDGVWVESVLCFGGGDTRWVRNLREHAATITLGGEAEAVIVDGLVEWVTDPTDPIVEASTRANRAKYPEYFSGDDQPFRPFFRLTPQVAYGWELATFAHTPTRCDWR